MPLLSLLFLISRNSPQQLGMVSLELSQLGWRSPLITPFILHDFHALACTTLGRIACPSSPLAARAR